MDRRNAVVDGVRELAVLPEAAAEKGARAPSLVSVGLRGGGTAFLDMKLPQSAVWAEVLHSLRETGKHAYLEVDPKTRVIKELLLPLAVTIGAIEPARDGKEGDLEVELVISHARHMLRRSHPEFSELLRALKRAQKSQMTVLVTETPDTHEIIDVRPQPKPTSGRR
jgi:hypothetical protein